MKEDNLDNLFKKLKSDFDVEIPNIGHQERFLAKLKTQSSESSTPVGKPFYYWKPLLSIAASLVICISVFTFINSNNKMKDLASVSPKMSETETFFTTAISEELLKLNDAKTPETENLINDVMKQMKVLENDYESLRMELTNNGDDKRIIYAMISNFQTRIDLLKNVLETIENVKQLKELNYENSITI